MATIQGDALANQLTGTALADLMFGFAGDDRLLGLEGDDILRGGPGNDRLNGGSGNDQMFGGQGNDTYVVDSLGDVVTENADQGLDTVRASISWSLGNHLEDLTLIGTAAINGTGNEGENIITGNEADNVLRGLGNIDLLIGRGGNDRLNGGTGDDILLGGAGNDTYVVDNALDLMSEKLINSDIEFFSLTSLEQFQSLPDAGGVDWVHTFIDYILPNDLAFSGNFENLLLVGTEDIGGTGNALANTLLGNAGNNVLEGAAGRDVLEGGAGDDLLFGGNGLDTFRFASGSNTTNTGSFSSAALGFDTIGDFTRGRDVVSLSQQTFGLSGTVGAALSAADFAQVATDAEVSTSTALIVFSAQSRDLFYNANRGAAGFGVPGAENPFASFLLINTLSAQDFVIAA